MPVIDASICQQLRRPEPTSHKGDNGRVLVIAGSEKYHGALLLTIQVLSRIVDVVYVASTPENLAIVARLKSEIAVFIPVSISEMWEKVALVDAVVIGPGLAEGEETLGMVKRLLTEYLNKPTVIDATALWQVDPDWLHTQTIVTPHQREFEHVFGVSPDGEQALAVAKKYHCIVVLKGRYDYVSDGRELWENRTGNVGMTKGGTGDVLAGLIAGLAAKNDLFIAARSGTYLNGLAGDRLYEKNSTFYNAEDVVRELGSLWQEMR